MTARNRPRRTRRPVGDDRTATEVLGPPAAWNGTTIAWEGASVVGLPDSGTGYDTSYDANGWDDPAPAPAPLAMLRAQPPAPDMFPALPGPPAAPVGYEVAGRETAKGWPHLGELRCDYPAALAATPIPCDSVWRDHTATTFRALRLSAQAAGWHMDRLGQWACPRCCQASTEYRGLYPVTIWDALAAEARVVGDMAGERAHRARAELGLRLRTVEHHHDSHKHGRHADELEVAR